MDTRPIENEDVKYAWGAYKSGTLKRFRDGLDPVVFKTEFEKYVLENAHAAWVVIGHTKNGFIPIGMVLGGWAPQATFMIIMEIVWFPWASKRSRLEGTVGFFNQIRKEMPCMGFAFHDDKPVYEVCCKHGIMRRIGTSHMTEKPAAVYEVRND